MDQETKRYIDRLFARQARKMRNIVARGVVEMVGDGAKMQTNQISLLDGEMVDGAERVQQYGYSSHPQAGAECFVVFAGAGREHALIFSVDDRRYRVKGSAAGEVVIYTDEGDTIHLKRGNKIEVTTKHYVVKAEEDVAIETKRFTLQAAEAVDITTAKTGIHTDALAFTNQSGGEVEAAFTGGLKASNDVKANNGEVSMREHVHSGVATGGGSTNKPVGG